MHYLLLTTFAVLLWSSLAVIVAQLGHVPPFFLLACCLFIGGSLSLWRYKQWQLKATLLLVGVCGIFGYHFLLFMALRLAPPVGANLLNYLWPLFILLFTPLFFREITLSKRQVFGTLVSLFGAGLIVAADGATFSSDDIFGYTLAILSALIWACYSLLSKKLTLTYAQFGSATVGLFCLISAGLAAASHLIFETTPVISWGDSSLIFLLGLGPMGISFYCWDGAVKKGDPRVIATISYFTPLLSTLMLVAFSEQVFSQEIFIAMCLIVSGALLANLNLRSLQKTTLRQ
ncbi:DMT family transporter [Cognaticolwellia aestuarii]|uniref:DMT family transporter n=1 Tax=Cognaticolwellia aestuarii TaxID=329993 RepID=UPI0009864A76|nr:DMT family transporter [Cognaticolwellia aestuarii]